MKKISLLYTLCLSLLTSFFVSCSDWTDVEAEDFSVGSYSDEYYTALRAYKQTNHQLSFGWFAWEPVGSYMKGYLSGIPDSVDIVSLWTGATTELSDIKRKDLSFVQQVKGTKVVRCMFASSVPEEFGWDGSNPTKENEIMVKAVQAYAKSICDEINIAGYDGLDIDYEPTVGGPEAKGNLANNRAAMEVWIEALGKYLGPKSGTNKLLLIDGEISHMFLENHGRYFNYFVSQAYGSDSDSSLEWRLKELFFTYGEFSTSTDPLTEQEITEKLIVTENFEATDRAMNGGYNFTTDDGKKIKSLEGMARWMPDNGFRKAGVGTFHMEAEFGTNPEYKWLRNAIQIMNPSSQSLVEH